jgi:hypothetical protein
VGVDIDSETGGKGDPNVIRRHVVPVVAGLAVGVGVYLIVAVALSRSLALIVAATMATGTWLLMQLARRTFGPYEPRRHEHGRT